MKIFPITLLIIPLLLFVTTHEVKSAERTFDVCDATKREAKKVSRKFTKLMELKKKNEELFDKFKNNFNAKVKISSNLFIIQTRTEPLILRKKLLTKQRLQLRCQGPTS